MPRWPSITSTPGLSPREREVATLAAEGLTNQEIATRLALARRTVESHVANALRKLGSNSRRDLGRLLDAADRTSPVGKVQ